MDATEQETTRLTASLTEGEKTFVRVLVLVGWRFGGMLRRGIGWRLNFWRGDAPPETAHCPRASIRSFTLRKLRSVKP